MKLAYRALVGLLALLCVCIAAEVRAAEATWPKAITLGTASPGGPYYVYGQGVATILSHALGIEVTAQATQGPSQNVALLEKGEAMLGFTTMGVALQGWNGTGWTKGTQYRAMRAIFPMFDTPFQFVVPKKSAIRSVAELAGKRLGDGPRAGTGGIYFPEVFKALGIQVVLRNSSWEDALSKVVSGEFGGMAVAAGVPLPALAETDAKEPMVFIAPSSAQIATLREHLPELSLSTIPAGSYSSMTEDYHTVGLFNSAIAQQGPAGRSGLSRREVRVRESRPAREGPPGGEGDRRGQRGPQFVLAVPSRRRPLLSRNRHFDPGCIDREGMKAARASNRLACRAVDRGPAAQ